MTSGSWCGPPLCRTIWARFARHLQPACQCFQRTSSCCCAWQIPGARIARPLMRGVRHHVHGHPAPPALTHEVLCRAATSSLCLPSMHLFAPLGFLHNRLMHCLLQEHISKLLVLGSVVGEQASLQACVTVRVRTMRLLWHVLCRMLVGKSICNGRPTGGGVTVVPLLT